MQRIFRRECRPEKRWKAFHINVYRFSIRRRPGTKNVFLRHLDLHHDDCVKDSSLIFSAMTLYHLAGVDGFLDGGPSNDNKSGFQYLLFLVVAMIGSTGAEDLKSIQLLPPQMDGGKPLMQAFQKRSTSRDFSRMGRSIAEEKDVYAHADAAFIGQNVYLFCATEGLSTVFRASIDKPALANAIKLREDQKYYFHKQLGTGKNKEKPWGFKNQ